MASSPAASSTTPAATPLQGGGNSSGNNLPQIQPDGSIIDPTGLRTDSTGNGAHSPGTGSSGIDDGGGDVPIGAAGRNHMYDAFLAKVHQLAKDGQALGNLAASFNPIANAITAISGRNPDGTCASKGERVLAGIAAAAGPLGELGEFGEDAMALFRRGCFVAGTPVQMADGSTKPIEQIVAGDLVLSRDQNAGPDGQVVASRVTRTYEHDHPRAQMVTVTLSSGEQIECTDNHPFFVPGSGWVPAGKLCLGTQVTPRAGPDATATVMARVTIVSVVPFAAKAGATTPVNNFEVEGTHTYFVGTANGGEWVHNICIPGVSTVKQALKALEGGDVRVGTRAEAEEIALAFAGYKNTTGEARGEAELLARMNQNPGYYHWSDGVVVENGVARVAGHSSDDMHGLYRHLQIRTFDGRTIRVFYGQPVR